MSTPHARPGYISRNTDGGSLHEPVTSTEKDLNSKEYGADNDFSKADVEVDIQNGSLHRETSEDGSTDKNVPVESAADLVTQIIHLEDNPEEASLTFRTWFLGKRDVLMYLFDALSGVFQVLGFRSSPLCCKKSSTSSLRRFSCLWSF